jgi:hypothetical protein
MFFPLKGAVQELGDWLAGEYYSFVTGWQEAKREGGRWDRGTERRRDGETERQGEREKGR